MTSKGFAGFAWRCALPVPVLIVVMELTEERDKVLEFVMTLGVWPLELELVMKLGGRYLELELVMKLGVRCLELVGLAISAGMWSLELEPGERLLSLLDVMSPRLLFNVIDSVAVVRDARLLPATI